MMRNVIGVVAGLIVAWAGVSASMAMIVWILGPDRVLAPNVWSQSWVFIAATLAIGFVAALAGGATCQVIARDRRTVGALVAVIVVLGIFTGAGEMMRPGPAEVVPAREPGTTMEHMHHAYQQGWIRTPFWLLIVNPLIGAAGVLVGAMLVPSRSPRDPVRKLPDETKTSPSQ